MKRHIRSLNQTKAHRATKKIKVTITAAIVLAIASLSWKSLSEPESPIHILIPALARSVMDPTFYVRISLTFSYLVAGILLSFPFALIIGLLAGWKKKIDNIFMPISIAFGSLPSFAVGPLAIFLLGPTISAVILAIVPQSFFLQFEVIRSGAKEVPPEFFDTASALNFDDWRTLTRIIIPPILPRIIEGFRLSLTTLWDTVMAAEIFANIFGVGSFVFVTTTKVEMAAGLIAVLSLTLTAILIDSMILRNVEDCLKRWK